MPHEIFVPNRRRFLKAAALATGATLLPDWFLEETRSHAAPARPLSANDRPNIALIGCGGMGRHDTKLASEFAHVIAVCDVDAKRAEEASKQFGGAKIFGDFRKLLERDDLHAVINATPDHWHTLVNMAAMKAGKDVYSEKPLTLTIDEGRRLVKLARRTKRILQTGSQQRSDPNFRLACELVRNGRLGTLRHVITSLPAGPRGGPFNPSAVPPELDWNTWQGQTAAHEYVKERCHTNFRYWYDYSGGTMTDWGAHHNDIALWGLGLERSGPVSIEGRPLIEMIPGGYTAAAEYRIEYAYANGVTHTCQSTTSNNPSGGKISDPKPGELPHGVKFEGSDGWIFVTRGKIEASRPELLSEPLTSKKVSLYVSSNHMGNFIECIRTRRQPICDVEIGHRSVSVCHLGVIAMRLGRKLRWSPARERFVGDREANTHLAREMRKPFDYQYV